jgi:glycosyltransferase involved in cell wall biosynthesis
MFLSVIVAAKDWNKALEKTISSILNQSIDDFEIIVQMKNNPISEGFSSIYSEKSVQFYIERDAGIYDAMNRGINKAKGDFILFLGEGDYLIDNFVIEYLKEFSTNENIAFFGQVFYYHGDSKVIKSFKIRNRPLSKNDFRGGNPIHTQGLFIKKELYQLNNYNCEYKILADFEFLMNGNKWETLVFVPRPVVMFAIGGVSTNISYAFKTRKEAIKILLKNKIIPSFRLLLAFLYYSTISFYKKNVKTNSV